MTVVLDKTKQLRNQHRTTLQSSLTFENWHVLFGCLLMSCF